MSDEHWWMVRAGRRGALLEDFFEQKCIGVGFIDADLSNCPDKVSIRNLVERDDPARSKAKIDNIASQLDRFKNVFKKGDTVVTFDADARIYHVGTIRGDYVYYKESEYKHGRAVDWFAEVPRDVLSIDTRNTLGSALTIFAIEGAVQDELAEMRGKPGDVPKEGPEQVEEDVELYFLETERRAAELIADAFDAISPDRMVDVVHALLRATGYHARRGAAGADRGVDLYASPDPWMVRAPRIKVQVKHRSASRMGGPEIRNFIGTLQEGERGVFVSTGGFSKDARYEAERSSRPLSLMDRSALIALYLEHYGRLDEDIRALVQVKQVYLPVNVGAK